MALGVPCAMLSMRLRDVLATSLVLATLSTAALASAQHRRAHPSDAFEAPDASIPPEVPVEATFAYESTRTVSEGNRAYEGYSDRLVSTGLYTLQGNSEQVQVHAEYTWRYDGDPCDDGHENRDVTVDAARLYEGRTDLDDYDDKPGPLATWLWVPSSLEPEDHIQVLDRDFVCVSRTEGPGGVITVRADYSERRVDGYGNFLYRVTDDYQFDTATGFFVSESVVEQAEGTTEGMVGGFTMRTMTRVTEATYLGAPSVAAPRAPSRCATNTPQSVGRRDLGEIPMVWAVIGLIAGVALIVWFARRPRRKKTHDVEAWRGTDVPGELSSLSPIFAPFIPHFIATAQKTSGAVYVAKALGLPTIIGLGLVDRETKLGTIFTSDGDACEELRRALGVEEFFSETQHAVLPSVRAYNVSKAAYNMLETYDVLTRVTGDAPAYDPDVVSRMKPEDRDAILALSLRVHGLRGEAWFDASLAGGDLCFVARVEGHIVGFAMMTVAGEHARLHTNTVHHDFRGRGIGKELTRARIHAAHALGATKLLTEVATWNVASLEVVRSLGFERKGAMYVQTSRDTRTEQKALRR